jgi:hypothetical protein
MRKLLLQSLLQSALTERMPDVDDAHLAELARNLGTAARRRLGRSLSIREVDAGSCNGCELEIHALNNAFYDIERFGLRFVASPRHADVLLVTGPVTKNMREALERTYCFRQELCVRWASLRRDPSGRQRCGLPAGTDRHPQGLAGSVEPDQRGRIVAKNWRIRR